MIIITLSITGAASTVTPKATACGLMLSLSSLSSLFSRSRA
jgi:hypothetical protein